jgi:hypothetical protein
VTSETTAKIPASALTAGEQQRSCLKHVDDEKSFRGVKNFGTWIYIRRCWDPFILIEMVLGNPFWWKTIHGTCPSWSPFQTEGLNEITCLFYLVHGNRRDTFMEWCRGLHARNWFQLKSQKLTFKYWGNVLIKLNSYRKAPLNKVTRSRIVDTQALKNVTFEFPIFQVSLYCSVRIRPVGYYKTNKAI